MPGRGSTLAEPTQTTQVALQRDEHFRGVVEEEIKQLDERCNDDEFRFVIVKFHARLRCEMKAIGASADHAPDRGDGNARTGWMEKSGSKV